MDADLEREPNVVRAGRRVYWFLSGPREMASSRLHGYLINELLRSKGWESYVLMQPRFMVRDIPFPPKIFENSSMFRAGDIVVFQKLHGPKATEALHGLRIRAVTTVLIDCDPPLKCAEARLATLTVCTSRTLVASYMKEGITSCCMIYEPYEAIRKQEELRKSQSSKLRCLWFGNVDPSKEGQIRQLKLLIENRIRGITLSVLSNSVDADHKWSLSTACSIIQDHDVTLITGDRTPMSEAKSPNRAIQSMALAVPVIAFPNEANSDIIRHGRNGYLCEDDEEWLHALLELTNRAQRYRIATVGYRYARRFFSPEHVWRQWTNRFGEPIEAPTGRVERMCFAIKLRWLRSRIWLSVWLGLFQSVSPLARIQKEDIGRFFAKILRLWPKSPSTAP